MNLARPVCLLLACLAGQFVYAQWAPNCEVTNNYAFVTQPDDSPEEYIWGDYATNVYAMSRMYGTTVRTATGGWIGGITWQFSKAPNGLYSAVFELIQEETYNPCTGEFEDINDVTIISTEIGNRHPQFGGTDGIMPTGTLILPALYARMDQGNNPLGRFRYQIRLDGTVNGAPNKYDFPGFEVIMLPRMASDGSAIEEDTNDPDPDPDPEPETDYTPWWQKLFNWEPDEEAEERLNNAKADLLKWIPTPIFDKFVQGIQEAQGRETWQFEVPYQNGVVVIDMWPWKDLFFFLKLFISAQLIWQWGWHFVNKGEDAVSQSTSS